MGTNNCTKGPLSPGCLTQPSLDAQMGARNDHPAVEPAEMNAQPRRRPQPAAPHGRRDRHGRTPAAPQTPAAVPTPTPEAPVSPNASIDVYGNSLGLLDVANGPTFTLANSTGLGVGASYSRNIVAHPLLGNTRWSAGGEFRYGSFAVSGSDVTLPYGLLTARVTTQPVGMGLSRGTSRILGIPLDGSNFRWRAYNASFVELGAASVSTPEGREWTPVISTGTRIGVGAAVHSGSLWVMFDGILEFHGLSLNTLGAGAPRIHDLVTPMFQVSIVPDGDDPARHTETGLHTYTALAASLLQQRQFNLLVADSTISLHHTTLPGSPFGPDASLRGTIRGVNAGLGIATGTFTGATQVPATRRIMETGEAGQIGMGVLYGGLTIAGVVGFVLSTADREGSSEVHALGLQMFSAPATWGTAQGERALRGTPDTRRAIAGAFLGVGALLSTLIPLTTTPSPITDNATQLGGHLLTSGLRWMIDPY